MLERRNLYETESEEIFQKLKHATPEELATRGIIEPARKSGYVCPYCGNGTGDDGTGIDMKEFADGYGGTCFKCQTGFDNVDLVAKKFNLDRKNDFKKILNAWAEASTLPSLPEKSKPKAEKKIRRYEFLIRQAHKNLKDFVDSQGGSYRGLTFDTLDRFYCGFLPEWGQEKTERLIVPDSWTHYLARFTGDVSTLSANKQKTIRIKQHRGTKSVFNLLNAARVGGVVFIPEGEIDAMSIIQSGFEAISFGGCRITTSQANELKKFPPSTKFVIIQDTDETGEIAAPKMQRTLRENGFISYITKISSDYKKDANDLLQENPDLLKETLHKILACAEKFFSSVDQKLSGMNENPPTADGWEDQIERLIPESTSTHLSHDPLDSDPNAVRMTQDYIPSCPVNIEIPEGFFMDETGILKVGKRSFKKVSDTPLVITKVIKSESSDDAQIELAAYDQVKKIWHKHAIPLTDVSDSRKLLQLAAFDISVTQNRARDLSDFLMDMRNTGHNRSRTPECKSYRVTGWKADGTFCYPPGDGENYIVQNSGFDYKSAFCTEGDVAEWKNLLCKVISQSAGTRACVGFALAAPLVKLFRIRNLQLHLNAKSGSGKSAAVGFAMSIFGNPDKLKKVFNSTRNFSDQYSSKFNDLPVWIDEFQTASSRVREEMDTMIYNFAEGITRGRLRRDGTEMPQHSFRGVRFTTGEQSLLSESSGHGAFARFIELDATNIMPDDLAVNIHRTISSNYGHIGAQWIEYISKHTAQLTSLFRSIEDQLRPLKILPAHASAIAAQGAAFIGFCDMMNLAGEAEALSQVLADMDSLISALPERTKVENASRALEYLSDTLTMNEKNFRIETDAYDENDKRIYHEPVGFEIWGTRYSDGGADILPRALKKILTDAGFPSATAIIKEFHNRNILVESNSKGHEWLKNTKINGRWVWAYRFRPATFSNEEVYSTRN